MDDADSMDDTVLPLRVWLALFSSAKQIEAVVRRNLREVFASTLPRFDLLSQLYRTSDGLTMGDLSNRLMVTNGNITGMINSLVRDGLVERAVDPEDRRVQWVCLSRKGRRCFGSMVPANQAWISEVMAGMTVTELRELQTLLTKLKASVSAIEHGLAEVPPAD